MSIGGRRSLVECRLIYIGFHARGNQVFIFLVMGFFLFAFSYLGKLFHFLIGVESYWFIDKWLL